MTASATRSGSPNRSPIAAISLAIAYAAANSPFPGVLEQGRDQQIAALDAFTTLALEQSLRPSKPAAGGRRLPQREEKVADPPCAACSARPFARGAVRVVCLLERGAVLLVETEHVCRVRQQLEVVRRKQVLLVCPRERVERV
jgi:hypothetical protein